MPNTSDLAAPATTLGDELQLDFPPFNLIETPSNGISNEANLNPETSTETTQSLESFDIIVVGGGPAGLTAAIYATRAGKKTLVLEGEYSSPTEMPGGQLMLTNEIENFPGFPKASGAELMFTMRSQAEELGAKILTKLATHFDFATTDDDLHKVFIDGGGVFTGKAVILATGAVARRLGVPGEDIFFGMGVSTCASCDGAFFADEDVIVVGGGDSAIEDALYMSNIAKTVTVIHRREEFKAQGKDVDALLAKNNVKVVWNAQLTSILGDTKVRNVGIDILTPEGVHNVNFEAGAVFVAIGHDPATSSFIGGDTLVALREDGYVRLFEGKSTTSVPRVFAAGDLVDSDYRQAITAAASGCRAAMDAIRILK